LRKVLKCSILPSSWTWP